nr:unnamed protein product [Digitaria exilis]
MVAVGGTAAAAGALFD